MVISSGEKPLTELVRRLVRQELQRKETTGGGGNTLITSEKDLHLVTRGTHKIYANGIAIGSGSGTITGSGTTNYLPRFTGATAIGNSHLIDDGSTITSSEDIEMLAKKTVYYNGLKTGEIFSKKTAVETIDYYGLQITPYNTHETNPGSLFIGDNYAAPAGDGIKITDVGIWLYPSGAYSLKINNSIAFQGTGGGQLGRARFENLSTPPTTDKGGVYYDTDDNNVYVNKGTYAAPSWQLLGGFENPLLEDLTIKEASPMLYFQNASGNPLGSIGSLGGGFYIGNDVDSGSIYLRTGATPATRVQIYDTGVALGVPLDMNSGIIQSLSYLRTPDGLALLMQYGTTAPASKLMIGSGITAYTSIAMSSNKITGLAAGTVAGDAVSIGQLIESYSVMVYISGSNYITVASTGIVLYSGTSASTAIQTAINNAGTGKKTFIKSGIYPIDTEINILYDDFTLEGETFGQFNAVQLKATTNYTGVILRVGSSASGFMTHRVTLRNVELKGNVGDASVNTVGLLLYSGGGVFENLWSYNNGTHGILAADHVDGASENHFLNVRTCTNSVNGLFIQCPDTSLIGISSYLNGQRGVEINGGGTYLDGANIWQNGEYGIAIEGATTGGVYHIIISNCIIETRITGGLANILINVASSTGTANDINIHDNVFYSEASPYPSEHIRLSKSTATYELDDINIHDNRFGGVADAVQAYGANTSNIRATIHHNRLSQHFIDLWHLDWHDNQGFRTENGGQESFIGNGVATSFQWAHGIINTPNVLNVTKMTANIPIWWIGKDVTYITVYFESAIPNGQDLIFGWDAKLWHHNAW